MDDIEQLGNRIAEALARRGMGERHASASDDANMDRSRDSLYATKARMVEPNDHSGPLVQIAKRIQMQSAGMREIARNLNDHADRVTGYVPMAPETSPPVEGPVKGMPAVQAIMDAIDGRDR